MSLSVVLLKVIPILLREVTVVRVTTLYHFVAVSHNNSTIFLLLDVIHLSILKFNSDSSLMPTY